MPHLDEAQVNASSWKVVEKKEVTHPRWEGVELTLVCEQEPGGPRREAIVGPALYASTNVGDTILLRDE